MLLRLEEVLIPEVIQYFDVDENTIEVRCLIKDEALDLTFKVNKGNAKLNARLKSRLWNRLENFRIGKDGFECSFDTKSKTIKLNDVIKGR